MGRVLTGERTTGAKEEKQESKGLSGDSRKPTWLNHRTQEV